MKQDRISDKELAKWLAAAEELLVLLENTAGTDEDQRHALSVLLIQKGIKLAHVMPTLH